MCLAANKLVAFIDGFKLTEISDAVTVSEIAIGAVRMAEELDEGVLTRLRIDRERNEAARATAEQAAPTSPPGPYGQGGRDVQEPRAEASR